MLQASLPLMCLCILFFPVQSCISLQLCAKPSTSSKLRSISLAVVTSMQDPELVKPGLCEAVSSATCKRRGKSDKVVKELEAEKDKECDAFVDLVSCQFTGLVPSPNQHIRMCADQFIAPVAPPDFMYRLQKPHIEQDRRIRFKFNFCCSYVGALPLYMHSAWSLVTWR
jgi:hypothetical protein